MAGIEEIVFTIVNLWCRVEFDKLKITIKNTIELVMRRSSKAKHPLGVLRAIIGLGQSELAELIERSPRTIQAIEINRLPLSEEIAVRVSHETGVATEWLLDGNPAVPPWAESAVPVPYTKEHFEITRAQIRDGKNPNDLLLCEANLRELLGDVGTGGMVERLFNKIPLLRESLDIDFARILSALYAAQESGRLALASYKVSEFTKTMVQEFGQVVDGQFTSQGIEVLTDCLATLLMAKSLAASQGIFSQPPASPGTPRKKGVDDYLDVTHDLAGVEGCADANKVQQAVRHFMDRAEVHSSFRHSAKEALRHLSQQPQTVGSDETSLTRRRGRPKT